MVDASRVEARVQRLEELIERLDEVRQAGEDAYLADEQKRAATERWLQVAVQICIDLGTQLVTEQSALERFKRLTKRVPPSLRGRAPREA